MSSVKPPGGPYGIMAEGVQFFKVQFVDCCFANNYLYDCHFKRSKLLRGDFRSAKFVKGSFDEECAVDPGMMNHETHFHKMPRPIESVRLRSMRRRNSLYKYWKKYYDSHTIATFPMRMFLFVVDYGQASMWRLILIFSLVVFTFSQLYLMPYYGNLLIVKMHFQPFLQDDGWPYRAFEADCSTMTSIAIANTRSLYFSLVVVTTLGFGDIKASPSCAGTVIFSWTCIYYVSAVAGIYAHFRDFSPNGNCFSGRNRR
jgi:hypothetical protein